jgi:hypothetical protein
MEPETFKKWIEDVDKIVSSQVFELSGLKSAVDPNFYLEKSGLLQDAIDGRQVKHVYETCDDKKMIKKRNNYRFNKLSTGNEKSGGNTMYKKLDFHELESIGNMIFDKELTFKPFISKNSIELARKSGNSRHRVLGKSSEDSDSSLNLKEVYHMYNKNSLSSLSTTKSNLIAPSSAAVSINRMANWEKARLEKQKFFKKKQLKAELEKCSFRPIINKSVPASTHPLPLAVNTPKTYFKKHANPPPTPLYPKSPKPDLDSIEFDHAVKRLHWELNSINLN